MASSVNGWMPVFCMCSVVFMAKSPKCVKVLCCGLSRHDPCRLIMGDIVWSIGLVVLSVSESCVIRYVRIFGCVKSSGSSKPLNE